MKYRHLIWDWNGTLLDDVEDCIDTLNDLLARRNLARIDLATYQRLFDFPVIDFYRLLGFDFNREDFDAVADEYIAGYQARLPRCRLQPDARAVLARVRDLGLSQSVLSAYHQLRLEEAMVLFGLRDFFVRLVGLDDYRAHSKVDNGRRWLAEMPHDPAEVLLVGDTLHDHEVARALGVDCVLLTCGHHGRARLAPAGVPLLDRLADLSDLLTRA